MAGGTKKYEKNKIVCLRYRNAGTRDINALRDLIRHCRRYLPNVSLHELPNDVRVKLKSLQLKVPEHIQKTFSYPAYFLKSDGGLKMAA